MASIFGNNWKQINRRIDNTGRLLARLRRQARLAKPVLSGPPPSTWEELRKAWGIAATPQALQSRVRQARTEAVLYVGLALLGLGWVVVPILSGKWSAYALLGFIILPCAACLATVTGWRLSCLRARRFVPFRHWLFGRR